MRELRSGDVLELRDATRSLHAGATAIDCGAHVGNVTAAFAATGARVIAFEPNPAAFASLRRRFEDADNVRCVNAAVSDRGGRARLYLHRSAAEDPVKWAVGSSLFAAKGNVDAATSVEVETVDLDGVIRELPRVDLLKLDVEGAEVPILARMIETGRLIRIGLVLVEMHDTKIPDLRQAGAELRKRLTAWPNVRLDWR